MDDTRRLVYIQRPTFAEEGRYLHVWVGPFGLHLFWPDFWKSRPDFWRAWREPMGEA